MKKSLFIMLIITALMISGCQANSETKTVEFTDDLGRTVTLPANIERVAPSGNPSQILLFTLAPDKMVGWASKPRKYQAKYIAEKYQKLPEFGAFYGKKGNLNLEELMAANAQLVVDFGERKKGIEEQLDQLQAKIGVPIIFIEGDIDRMGQAYRHLGKVLDVTEKAEKLAKFCEGTINYATEKSALVKTPLSVYLGDGDLGYEAISASNIHGRVIQLVGADNVAKLEGNLTSYLSTAHLPIKMRSQTPLFKN